MPAAHPNILFIEVDQWPFFCLGRLGNPNVRTPNLDRLAAEGVHFTTAVCQSPICMPSRVSKLSGQYIGTNRQFGFSGLCDRRMPWLPEHLQQHGYATGASGKFHVACIGPERWGFDYAAPTLSEDEHLARPEGNHYHEYCDRHGIPWPTDQIHGHNWHNDEGNPAPSAADPDLPPAVGHACVSDVPEEHSLEAYTTDRGIEFLEKQSADAPFFLWLTYDRPHEPCPLPAEWQKRVRPDEIELPPLHSAEDLATLPRRVFDYIAQGPSIRGLGGEANFRRALANYYTLIEYIDHEIGRFLDRLESLGLADNTIVCFTADHGDEGGRNGLLNKGRHCASVAITHVPLLLRLPADLRSEHAADRRIDAPVEVVDLFRTFCGLADLPVPDGVEGRDLGPVLRGVEVPDPARPVFCEEYRHRMIRQGDWMLTFDRTHDAECLLFNLAEDPHQLRNRYTEPERAPERIRLKRALLSFLVQREHGPYTDDDVADMRRALDPDDPRLPEHTPLRMRGQLHAYRCAAFVVDESHKLFVPFYEDDDLLLFALEGKPIGDMYSTRDKAIVAAPAVVETLLDLGLRDMMNRIHPVSRLLPDFPGGPLPTLAEAETVANGMRAPV